MTWKRRLEVLPCGVLAVAARATFACAEAKYSYKLGHSVSEKHPYHLGAE